MVSLRTLATAVLAVPLVSALTASQIVQNIRTLTTKSQALQAPAQSISIINGPLIIIGQGPFPILIAGFTDIVSTATVAIAAMTEDRDTIADVPGAKAIADAFREFVRVHQALLNILIGKAGLLNPLPIVGQPIATILRQIESVVDTIAYGLIDIISPADERRMITSDSNSLHGTIEVSIKAYEGVDVGNLDLGNVGVGKKAKRAFVA
ncbi:hypothetical protein QBC37DRAFT_484544 [Rhypophila decipiens]|uniref:Uncharacterized protein n=1 Tax=Rhypophila decipiens TaxID=261697 RepID=A0AAN7B663_9PEZI|nr:hypothetical protein QBC37DRAFT_484544 [Rhypophila decipiens]